MDDEQPMRLILIDLVLLVVVPVAVGLVFAEWFAQFYAVLTGQSLGGSFLDFTEIGGLIFSFFLSLPLVYSSLFHSVPKAIAIILFLVLLVFFAFADLSHIYFPIILALIGYGIGWGIRKGIAKLRRP